MRKYIFLLLLCGVVSGYSQTYTKIRNNLAIIVGSDTLKLYKSGTTWYIQPSNQVVINDVDSIVFSDATSISSATDSTYVKFVNNGWTEGWLTIGQDTLRIDTTGSVAPTIQDSGYVKTIGDSIYGNLTLYDTLTVNGDVIISDTITHNGLKVFRALLPFSGAQSVSIPFTYGGFGTLCDDGTEYATFYFTTVGVTLINSTDQVANYDVGAGAWIAVYVSGNNLVIKIYEGVHIIPVELNYY